MKQFYLFTCMLVWMCTYPLHSQETLKPTPKQVWFVNGGSFGSVPTSLCVYDPSGDSSRLIDANIKEATSVQDMVIDGGFAYISADTYITRYNLSSGERTHELYTQDKEPETADGTGSATAGLNSKMLVYNSWLLVTRQGNWSDPEDGYNVRIYEKTDLSLVKKIPVSDQASDVVVSGDKAYVLINGGFMGTTSSVAIIDLKALVLEKEVNIQQKGLEVMSLIVKDDKIYGGKSGSELAVLIYDIINESSELIIYGDSQYDSSPLLKPMTGDTLLVKKESGFVLFNTNTNTAADEIVMPAPAENAGFVANGAAYDSEEQHYYVAYSVWGSKGVGLIYNSDFEAVGRFDSVGHSPEVIRISSPLPQNFSPTENQKQSDQTCKQGEEFQITLSGNLFSDPENDPVSVYLKNAGKYSEWLSFDPETGTLTGNYPVSEKDTVLTLTLLGIDPYGLSAESTFQLTLTGEQSSGIGSVKEQKALVYPNPVENGFRVELAAGERAVMQLFDLKGSLLLKKEIGNSEYTDISGYPSGRYVLRIEENNGTTSSQVIIKK